LHVLIEQGTKRDCQKSLLSVPVRDGHGAGSDPATFFGSGFEFLGKARSGFGMYGIMYVKAWQR